MASKHQRTKSDLSSVAKLAKLRKKKTSSNAADDIGVNTAPRSNPLLNVAQQNAAPRPQSIDDLSVSSAFKAPTVSEFASIKANSLKVAQLKRKIAVLRQNTPDSFETKQIESDRIDEANRLETLLNSVNIYDNDTRAAESLQQLEDSIDLGQKRKVYNEKLEELASMFREETPQTWIRSGGDATIVKRDRLLEEAANLRAELEDPWITSLGGINSVRQQDVDRINQEKGLAIQDPAEFKLLYQQLAIVDRYIRDVDNVANQWNTIRAAINVDQTKHNIALTDATNTINQKGLVLMNLSHSGDESSWGLREIINNVNNTNTDAEKGTIYIEAPFAFNLHHNPAAAVGAWIIGAKTSFPKSSYEVLVDAQNNGWKIVPLDATYAIGGMLDGDLLKQIQMQGWDQPRQLDVPEGNVPRQNYIARNLKANLYKDGNDSVGGVVTIGGSHIDNGKGGNLGGLISIQQSARKQLSENVQTTNIARASLIPQNQNIDYQHPNDFIPPTGYGALDANLQTQFDNEVVLSNGKYLGKKLTAIADKYGLSKTEVNDRIKELRKLGRVDYPYLYNNPLLRSKMKKINKALADNKPLAVVAEEFNINWNLVSVKAALKKHPTNADLLAKKVELQGQ